MSEWSIVHPWKGCVLAIEPGVRISPCPPFFLSEFLKNYPSGKKSQESFEKWIPEVKEKYASYILQK